MAMISFVGPVVAALTLWLAPLGSAPGWQTARTDAYALHYGSGKQTDAAMVETFLDTAHARIAEEFREHRPAELLDGVQLDVYLHPRPGEMASVQQATMTSNLERVGYKAEIHLLTPSAYGDGDSDAAEKERDTDYVFRQVVHEVAAVYVQRLSLRKRQGWRYDEAAPWFLQGYDEYLAGIHGRRAADTTLARYRDMVRSDPGRVRFADTIRVRNPYVDGAVLVAFLHESFGRKAVQNIWLGPERTFREALLAALKTDYAELERRWRRWLRQA